MRNQKILHSRGQKFLIHLSKRITKVLDLAIFLLTCPRAFLAETFPVFFMGFFNKQILLKPAKKYGSAYICVSCVGRLQFGQLRQLSNLDNIQL